MTSPDDPKEWPKGKLPEPLDPLNPPPINQYCDLVLKGGVIDGVIYPGALLELARHYRFQSIAGTSVGAIAAALAAAAEFARRYGSDDGFNEVIRKIPDELAEESDPKTKATALRALFQTDPALNRLFGVFVKLASVRMEKFWCELMRTVRKAYQAEFFNGFVAGFVIAELIALFFSLPLGDDFTHVMLIGLFGGILGGLFGGLLLVFWAIRREFKILAKTQGFGFCSGISTDDGKTPALTEWLHKGIQGAAGLPLGRPLTFKDLWNAPGGPHQADGRPTEKSIDLRMMTTAVSHGRPYELPVEDPSVRLFFKRKDLEPYFPKSILSHLDSARVSRKYTEIDDKYFSVLEETPGGLKPRFPDSFNAPYPDDPANTPDFWELPVGELPVLVAVRLSMNFPLLFRAVPLWAIDKEGGRFKRVGEPASIPASRFKMAWFTDGGVTSNFPIHFFDKPVPQWPTFGIFIADKSRRRTEDDNEVFPPATVWVTNHHTSGRDEKWIEIGETDAPSKGKVTDWSGFADYFKSILVTAKDWSDNAALRMPGVRDRVVTVFKNNEENSDNGGLNLNIPGQKVLDMAYRNGAEAGRRLARKFLTDPQPFNVNLTGTPGWLDHRWVRLNSYISALKAHLSGFSAAIGATATSSSIQTQIEQAAQKAPLKYEKYHESVLTTTQVKALEVAIKSIQSLEAAMGADKVVQPYTAKPQPELKVRPRL